MHGNLIASFALILSSFVQRYVCFAKVYPFEQPPPYAWDNPSFQECVKPMHALPPMSNAVCFSGC
jgi:hypothetical protein